jgi:CO/xanthine dehydrogenase Mo-binding subunit
LPAEHPRGCRSGKLTVREFDYARPADVREAVSTVSADPASAYLAGGTTLVDLMLKDGIIEVERLVDITRLPLHRIRRENDTLRVGALTTMEELAADPDVIERLPLRECYRVGAERFGWSERDPEVGSMRDGRWLVGYGMAGVTFGHYQAKCEARATLRRDGSALVCSGATDIGTGTYTAMTQLAAETLGLSGESVEFDLGDTAMPQAPQAGGSGLTVSLGSAVHNTCVELVRRVLDIAAKDEGSPLYGCGIEDVAADGGRIVRADEPSRGESYGEILTRGGLDGLTVDGDSSPSRAEMGVLVGSIVVSRLGRIGRRVVGRSNAAVPAGAFGARFVEVRIDPELGLLRAARVVSAIDAGRVLNEKLASSQIIGGTVGGMGMAMFEEAISDPGTGRIANATFGDYLVAVNADVPDLDVVFVGEPDPDNPIGVKGIGEVGLVGIAAAIANAVYHATGKRIRSLPITIDQLL